MLSQSHTIYDAADADNNTAAAGLDGTGDNLAGDSADLVVDVAIGSPVYIADEILVAVATLDIVVDAATAAVDDASSPGCLHQPFIELLFGLSVSELTV